VGVFEAIVVFVITWWLVFLPILSAGTRSQAEAGDVAEGTDPAAPVAAGLPGKALIATSVAGVVTLLAFVGMQLGWFSFLLPQSVQAG
jgi:predicted secreted protein